MTNGFEQATAFVRRSRWRRPEAVLWVALAILPFLFPDRIVLVTQILVAAMFALSLDLLLGYAGMISLGHAAFFGIGAYAAGILAAHGWSEPITGLVAAGLIAAATGYITGFIVARMNGVALLMVTMGFGLLVAELANVTEDWTGGSDGLTGMELQPLLGLFHFDMTGRTGFVYTLVVAFLAFAFVRKIVNSPF